MEKKKVGLLFRGVQPGLRPVAVYGGPEAVEGLSVVVEAAYYGSSTIQADMTEVVKPWGVAWLGAVPNVSGFFGGYDPTPYVPKTLWVVLRMENKHTQQQQHKEKEGSDADKDDVVYVLVATEHSDVWRYPMHLYEQKKPFSSSSSSSSSSSLSSSSVGQQLSLLPFGVSVNGEYKTPLGVTTLPQPPTPTTTTKKPSNGREQENGASATVHVIGTQEDVRLWCQADARVKAVLNGKETPQLRSLYASIHSSSYFPQLRDLPVDAPILVAFGSLGTTLQLEEWLHGIQESIGGTRSEHDSKLEKEEKTTSACNNSNNSDDSSVTQKDTKKYSKVVDGEWDERIMESRVDTFFLWIQQLVKMRAGTNIAVSSFLPLPDTSLPVGFSIPTPLTSSTITTTVTSLSSSPSSSLLQSSRDDGKQKKVHNHKRMYATAIAARFRAINAYVSKRCHELGVFYIDIYSMMEIVTPSSPTTIALVRPLLRNKLDHFLTSLVI